MSDLNYYGVHPGQLRPPHRGGLIAWGVVAIVIGSLYLLGGASSVVFVAVLPKITGRPASADALLTMGLAAAMSLAMGVGLLWLGIGCCQGRRWVRPLILAGGWVFLVSGVVSIVPVTMMMTAAQARQPQPFPGATVVIGAFTVVGAVLFVVVLPLFLVLWFRRPSVGQTLAVMDPVGRWTDGVPLTVLAWTIACVWMGGGLAVGAAGGAYLWFTHMLQGGSAAIGVAVGLALAAAGVGCLRRSGVAWGASIALFALSAASAVTFVVAGDTAEYQQMMASRTAALTTAFTPTAPSRAGPVTSGTTITPTTMTATVTAYTPSSAAFASRLNPGLAPTLLYAVALGFGLWVRPRVTGPRPAVAVASDPTVSTRAWVVPHDVGMMCGHFGVDRSPLVDR
jgi:hypothetical protein